MFENINREIVAAKAADGFGVLMDFGAGFVVGGVAALAATATIANIAVAAPGIAGVLGKSVTVTTVSGVNPMVVLPVALATGWTNMKVQSRMKCGLAECLIDMQNQLHIKP